MDVGRRDVATVASAPLNAIASTDHRLVSSPVWAGKPYRFVVSGS
jgi:hypothetical protein